MFDCDAGESIWCILLQLFQPCWITQSVHVALSPLSCTYIYVFICICTYTWVCPFKTRMLMLITYLCFQIQCTDNTECLSQLMRLPSIVISSMQNPQICWTTYTEAIFCSITIPKCDPVVNIQPLLPYVYIFHVPDLTFVQTVEDLYLPFYIYRGASGPSISFQIKFTSLNYVFVV